MGLVAGAASARGASTIAVAASAVEEEEKSIFQRVTEVEMWICKEEEWWNCSIYEFERSSSYSILRFEIALSMQIMLGRISYKV